MGAQRPDLPSPPTSRRRGRRRARRVTLAVVALAGACSVSLTPPVTWRLEDPSGRPLAGAWAAYHVHGSRFNPVDSASFGRDGRLVRVGGDGVLRIGRRLHLHRPWPLEGDLEPFVDLVYAPSVHHAFGPIARLTEDRGDGPVLLDRGRGLVVLAALSDDAEAWDASLRRLHSFVRYRLLPGRAGDREPVYDVDPVTLDALADALAAEVAAFVARHPPATSGEIRRAERWRDDVAELRARVAELDGAGGR